MWILNYRCVLPEHFYLSPARLEFSSVAAASRKKRSSIPMFDFSLLFYFESAQHRFDCKKIHQILRSAETNRRKYHNPANSCIFMCCRLPQHKTTFERRREESMESEPTLRCAWAWLEYMRLWSIYTNGICRLKYVRLDAFTIWCTVFYSTRTNTLWRASGKIEFGAARK